MDCVSHLVSPHSKLFRSLFPMPIVALRLAFTEYVSEQAMQYGGTELPSMTDNLSGMLLSPERFIGIRSISMLASESEKFKSVSDG